MLYSCVQELVSWKSLHCYFQTKCHHMAITTRKSIFLLLSKWTILTRGQLIIVMSQLWFLYFIPNGLSSCISFWALIRGQCVPEQCPKKTGDLYYIFYMLLYSFFLFWMLFVWVNCNLMYIDIEMSGAGSNGISTTNAARPTGSVEDLEQKMTAALFPRLLARYINSMQCL